jgi:hypothetical protein
MLHSCDFTALLGSDLQFGFMLLGGCLAGWLDGWLDLVLLPIVFYLVMAGGC